MTSIHREQITTLLKAWSGGDQEALDRLTPLVYRELHRLARRYMAAERPGHTLDATALVNEAYLRLVDVNQIQWQNRAHFFAMSARIMRRILVESARKRHRKKRGDAPQKVSLDDLPLVVSERSADLIALDDALTTLETLDPRKSQLVELRFFGGLSVEETAEVLSLSAETVHRDWVKAKAWLYAEMAPDRK